MRNYALFMLIAGALLAASLIFERGVAAISPTNTVTWDGGGPSENWSDPANWSGDVVPAAGDDVVFNASSIKNTVIDVNITVGSIKIDSGYTGMITQTDAASITVSGCSGRPCFLQNSGTFNGSSNTFTLNSGGFGALRMLGGTFNGGSGDIFAIGDQFSNPSVLIQGGAFRSTSGILTIAGQFGFQGVGTTFLHNNGTILLTSEKNETLTTDSDHPTIVLNNLDIHPANGVNYDLGLRVIVEGDLTLNDGFIGNGNNGSVIEARGNVTISPNFDGGVAALEVANGSGARTFTFTSDLKPPKVVVNDPAVTLNLSGPGTVTFPQGLVLKSGTVAQNDADVVFGPPAGGGFCYLQNGGTFNASAKTFTANSNGFGNLRMTGGTFNGSSGDMNLAGIGGEISIQGGTFTATSGTMTAPGNFRFQGTGTVFNHNNGTVNFTAQEPSFVSNDSDHPSITFNNVNIDLANGVNLGLGPVMIVLGNLNLNDGSIGQAGTVIDARGPVTISANFDGGPTNLTFSGPAEQTFTNNGGTNPTGTWTVNKPSGIVTAATDVILQTAQPLNITGGTFYLGPDSDLTAGAITIGGFGKFAADTSQTITLGGNLRNDGIVDLQGGGAACPQNDTILIRSSSPGTQRLWSTAAQGVGAFRLADVDIQDQAGSANVTVFNGTNSGNNGQNFTFDAACPTALGISPQTISVITGTTTIFESSGGIGTRTFTLAVNNSGGSITNAGAYKAGLVQHVTDTIRVTDSVGSVAEAVAFVTGPAAKMAFVQQPTTTGAGGHISPSITVAIQDEQGFTVPSATNTVILTIANNPAGGVLSGTTARDPVAGVATFDNISIDKLGSGYTLRAGTNPSSIQRPVSDAFDIVAGAPAALAFLVQPQNTAAGSVIAPPVKVAIVDGLGNIVPNANGAVTIAIGNGPEGSTLAGTTTVNAVNGVAAFSDLIPDKPGLGYTLIASSPSLASATSAAFNVSDPFLVTNTNDSGPGSLRQAMVNANAAPAVNIKTIRFNLPGSAPFVIEPASELPGLNANTILDATTQPGFNGSPLVELHGQRIFEGLIVRFHNVVKGLAITNFFIGIDVRGSGNTMAGNYVGLTTANTTGRNTIGILVLSQTQNTVIGGSSSADRNVVADSLNTGIAVQGGGVTIQGNYIGTDATGTVAVPNTGGINMGTFDPGINFVKDNVISGNNGEGLSISNAGEVCIVQNNIIGLTSDGTAPLPNTRNGVRVSGLKRTITGNRIFGNSLLGITLNTGTAPLPNDPLDADLRQNYPVLASAVSAGSVTTIKGSLDSTPSQGFTLEFFSSPSCDASGNGEGETFLGSMSANTDAGGIAGFSVDLPVNVAGGRFITATATDANGSTSEFSRCLEVVGRHSISGRITLDGVPVPNLFVAVTQGTKVFTTLTNSSGDYSFTGLPEGLSYIITPQKPGFILTPPQRGIDNLADDLTGQDFAATQPKFSISGRVTTDTRQPIILAGLRRRTNLTAAAARGPFALGGVTMSLGGAENRTAQTDSSGRYVFNNLLPGLYTLSPSKVNFTFIPSLDGIQISGHDEVRNYTGSSPGLALLKGRIVYDANGSIRSMNADGSGVATVLSDGRAGTFSEPNISPDGTKIAAINSTGQTNIFSINADGSGRLVVRAAAGVKSPAWSPAGDKITFADAAPRVSTMNADGSSVAQAVTGCVSPDWSNDNVHLVCVRNGINIFTTLSGTVFNSTTGNKLNPRWSPDGTKIAFIDKTAPNAIKVMNSDGSGVQTAIVSSTDQYLGLAWSPDGARLAFVRQVPTGGHSGHKELIAIDPDGQDPLMISDNFDGTRIDWGPEPTAQTPVGSPVPIQTGTVSITFPNVIGAGVTTVVSISPDSAGTAPNGFVLGSAAFDISTTASIIPPITVCITMPSTTSLRQFSATNLMHNENGVLVNRTTSRNFASKQICGQVTSFSPFALAEEVDPLLPSITGLVLDAAGDPLGDVSVFLTGSEDRVATTDTDGLFTFSNLTDGASYRVQPHATGYVFTEYSQTFINVAGETPVVFTGVPAAFSLTGNVNDATGAGMANVSVSINGSVTTSTVTDSNGSYGFFNLPVDGVYTVNSSDGTHIFSPQERSVFPFLADTSGIDFTASLVTAANASLSGRVMTSSGTGISLAVVSLTDPSGQSRTTITNQFGMFGFDGLPTGKAYILNVSARRYRFDEMPRLISLVDDLSGFEIVGR